MWWPCEWTSCSILAWFNVVTTVLTLRHGFSETECYCRCASPDIGSYLMFVPPGTTWVLTCVLKWMPTFYTSVTSLGSNSFISRTGVDNNRCCSCTWYPQFILMFITECRQFLKVCLMIWRRYFKHILSETGQILQACVSTSWQLLRTVCQCAPYTDTFYTSATTGTHNSSSSALPVTVMLYSWTYHVLTVTVWVPHGQLPQMSPSHTSVS